MNNVLNLRKSDIVKRNNGNLAKRFFVAGIKIKATRVNFITTLKKRRVKRYNQSRNYPKT